MNPENEYTFIIIPRGIKGINNKTKPYYLTKKVLEDGSEEYIWSTDITEAVAFEKQDEDKLFTVLRKIRANRLGAVVVHADKRLFGDYVVRA